MESRHHIRFVCQLFGSLTQIGFLFQILFEVILAEFIVQLYHVVKLFRVQLICFPQFIDLAHRYLFDFVPLLLKLFKFVIDLTCVFRIVNQSLHLVEYVQLLLQVSFFFLLQFCCHRTTLLFDGTHDFLEFCFQRIRDGSKFFWISALLNKVFACRILLGFMQFVKHLFQVVYLLFVSFTGVVVEFCQTCYNFFLSMYGRKLRFSVILNRRNRSFGSVCCRNFS